MALEEGITTHLVQSRTFPLDILPLPTSNVLVKASVHQCDTNDGGDIDGDPALVVLVKLLEWHLARDQEGWCSRTKSVVRETIEEDHPLKPKTSFARLMTAWKKQSGQCEDHN